MGKKERICMFFLVLGRKCITFIVQATFAHSHTDMQQTRKPEGRSHNLLLERQLSTEVS